MNPNKYTEKAQEALVAAGQLAERAGHPEVLPEHLLLALVEQEGGIVPSVLAKMNIDPAGVASSVQALVAKLPQVHGGAQPGLSSRLRSVANAAEDEAARLKDEFTSTEHFLIALASESGRQPMAQTLKNLGITKDAVLQALTTVRGSQRVTDQNPEGKYQALERYGRDLTAVARKGKLDPVIGRDEEIRRVIQVLARRTKNNPCSSANRASARQPSWKDWPSGSCAATSPKACATRRSSRSTWVRSSPAPSIAASSKSASRPCSRKSPTRRAP
jgi:ATP-dependent Clp protease ATP-binding subunit ClpA